MFFLWDSYTIFINVIILICHNSFDLDDKCHFEINFVVLKDTCICNYFTYSKSIVLF